MMTRMMTTATTTMANSINCLKLTMSVQWTMNMNTVTATHAGTLYLIVARESVFFHPTSQPIHPQTHSGSHLSIQLITATARGTNELKKKYIQLSHTKPRTSDILVALLHIREKLIPLDWANKLIYGTFFHTTRKIPFRIYMSLVLERNWAIN